jgi:peptide/nickel transport system permease protein
MVGMQRHAMRGAGSRLRMSYKLFISSLYVSDDENVIRFIAARLGQSLIVMLAVGAISFGLFRFVGDPVEIMVSVEETAETRAAIREKLGLNDSVVTQFQRYIVNAARGEFGISYRTREPVASMIFSRLPATLELVLCASIFALALGIPLGIISALYRNTVLGASIEVGSLIGISLPTFMTGTLLILVFSVMFRILPSFGRGDVVEIGGWTTGLLTTSGLLSLIMPTITLGLFQLTMVMRLMRGEMIEVLRTDFIRFARARGLPRRMIYFGHALKNSLVPVITVMGMQLGALIAFAIVTESVFQWPGMGLLFVQSITSVDIPVMAAYLMIVAAFFVMLNLAVDLAYVWIDPRVRDDMMMRRA